MRRLNEIKDMALYRAFREHPINNPDRRHNLSVVWLGRKSHCEPTIPWPRHSSNIPGIPFGPYTEHVSKVFRDADAANQRAEKYAAELNAQRVNHFIEGVREACRPDKES